MIVPSAKPSNVADSGSGQLSNQIVDIKWHGRHARFDLTLPRLARTVPIDLDPVTVGVAEVKGFADEMIRQPDKRHPVARGVREPGREIDALRHQQGEVIEPGVARGGACTGQLDEDEQLAPADAERRPASASVKELQADGPSVVAD